MNEALQPRHVPFYGDDLVAVQQPDGTIFVVFARVGDVLGLRPWSQARRIQAHAVLHKGLTSLAIQTAGWAAGHAMFTARFGPLVAVWGPHCGPRERSRSAEIGSVPGRSRGGALAGIQTAHLLIETGYGSPGASDSTALVHLQQIADMGRAITQMVEQQIELQRKQVLLDGRMDAAARIIKQVQGQVETVVGDLTTVHVRLGVLEGQVQPTGTITEGQAAEILKPRESARRRY